MIEHKENILSHTSDIMFKEVFGNDERIIGLSEGKKEIPKNFLSMNMRIEDISKVTGLTIDVINKLRH